MENKTFRKTDIPDLNYQGYYWMSNDQKPVVWENGKFDVNILTALPFVVECNMYAENENISVQIKNIDGEYHISIINLKNTAGYELSEIKKYIGHDINKDYLLVQGWKTINDPLCEDYETLVPAFTAFKGFV